MQPFTRNDGSFLSYDDFVSIGYGDVYFECCIFVSSAIDSPGQTKPIPKHLLRTILLVVVSNFRPITETFPCFMMLMLIFTAWKLRKWIDPHNRRWIFHRCCFRNKTAVCMKTQIVSHTQNIIQTRLITAISRKLPQIVTCNFRNYSEKKMFRHLLTNTFRYLLSSLFAPSN